MKYYFQDVRQRALFLMVYTATIASFPLAYLIPFLIDLSLCYYVALLILFIFWAWYLLVIVTTGLAFNIAIVYRKWIMRPSTVVLPQSQQQIAVQHQRSGGSGIDHDFHENLGKNHDSNSDDEWDYGIHNIK